MSRPQGTHYQRTLDLSGEDSIAKLARWVPPASRVLELGPATGYFTRFLNESLRCTVDAVELSPEMAEQARPWCRHLAIGDLEQLDLASTFQGETYDVIVCADVLEHLRDPWRFVERLAEHLASAGRLLVSVPNTAYAGLLIELMRGDFRYREEGLLDRSHLRFFTFDSLRDMLGTAGWHIWSAEPVFLALTDSEFRVRLEVLPPALRDELLARPDALCYQWLVDARREPPAQPLVLPAAPSEDRFQVRAFWRAQEPDFDFRRHQLQWGFLGRERQQLAFDLPPGQCSLALQLSDRCCFLHLHAITLADGAGETLWHWSSDRGALPAVDTDAMTPAGATLWLISAPESRLTLNVPEATVAATRRLLVELGAPLSADYLAAMDYWQAPGGLPMRLAACRASRDRLARRRQDAFPEQTSGTLPLILHLVPAGGGGIERMVRDLGLATAGCFQHYVLRVAGASWLLEQCDSATHLQLPATPPSAQCIEALAALSPSLLHLHSLSDELMQAAGTLLDATSAPLAITLHDVLFADAAAFDRGTWPAADSLPDPRRAELLERAQTVTAPSRFVADLAAGIYGTVVTVVPNGSSMPPIGAWNDDAPATIGGRPCVNRVAAMGALGGHKGCDHLFDIAARLGQDTCLVVIGFLDGQLAPGWADQHHERLATHPGASRVYVTGVYAPADLPTLFSQYRPQLVLFPGLVPESFSYTLSEAWTCGAIPVVPALGALAERCKGETGIRLPDTTDAGAIARCLDEWCGAEALPRRQALRAAIRAALHDLVPSTRRMGERFAELYQRFAAKRTGANDVDALAAFSALCEMNLDPAQFRAELRLLLDRNRELQERDVERRQWNEHLQTDIDALRQRNLDIDAELARKQDELRRRQDAIAHQATELATARRVLGDDVARWPRFEQLVRLAGSPGLWGGLLRLVVRFSQRAIR